MAQTIKGTGIYGDREAQVDVTHRALRVSIRPPEKGVFGSYRIALVSGLMAANLAAGAPIVAMRWAAVSSNALIRRVRFSAVTDATAFVAGSAIFDLIRATGFTVQDTGGASISLAGKSQTVSTRFSPSQIQIAASATGGFAIANTATLTAGTRTLDSNAMAILLKNFGTATIPTDNPAAPSALFDPSVTGGEPLELVQNEGFVIRATVPGTGTWKFGIEIDWDEVDAARFFA